MAATTSTDGRKAPAAARSARRDGEAAQIWTGALLRRFHEHHRGGVSWQKCWGLSCQCTQDSVQLSGQAGGGGRPPCVGRARGKPGCNAEAWRSALHRATGRVHSGGVVRVSSAGSRVVPALQRGCLARTLPPSPWDVTGCAGGCVGLCVGGCVGGCDRGCIGGCVGGCVEGCDRGHVKG